MTSMENTATRKNCPECDGTGGARSHYDYARQKRIHEFCWLCNGYGYVMVFTPADQTGAAA